MTEQEGRDTGEKIGAWEYRECSAKISEGPNRVFKAATRVGLDHLKATPGEKRRRSRLVWRSLLGNAAVLEPPMGTYDAPALGSNTMRSIQR